MTVSLVTYKHNLAAVKPIIDSVLASTIVEKFYIVDNSGETALRGEVESLDERIEYIPLNNPGFGAANNVAIRKAFDFGAKYHAVVNPDIEFNPGTLEKIVSFMEGNVKVGVVMPKTQNTDGSMQHNCKLSPSPFDLLLRRFLPKSWGKAARVKFEMQMFDHEKQFDVPFLCGCFLVFRLDALKEVGLFDERYFMYMEDVDLCRRIWSGGWRNVYYPIAEVIHAHAAESYHNFRMLKIHIKSVLSYFRKWGWILDFERRRINHVALSQKI